MELHFCHLLPMVRSFRSSRVGRPESSQYLQIRRREVGFRPAFLSDGEVLANELRYGRFPVTNISTP